MGLTGGGNLDKWPKIAGKLQNYNFLDSGGIPPPTPPPPLGETLTMIVIQSKILYKVFIFCLFLNRL